MCNACEPSIDELARAIHESTRGAVSARLVTSIFPEAEGFIEWSALPEQVQDARRIQAHWFRKHYGMRHRVYDPITGELLAWTGSPE